VLLENYKKIQWHYALINLQVRLHGLFVIEYNLSPYGFVGTTIQFENFCLTVCLIEFNRG